MMTECVRPLALAAILNLIVGVGGAAAQTVFLRHAAAGSAVEVFVNNVRVGGGTVDAAGEAKVPADIEPVVGKGEMDANLHVDSCPQVIRLYVLDAGRQPPPSEADCRRNQIVGLYWVRTVNTLVLNMASQTPSLMLIVGSYKPPPPGSEDVSSSGTEPPTGVVAFGGGQLGKYQDFATAQCGDVLACEASGFGLGYHFGGGYWLTRFLGAEASYVKPRSATVTGGGEGFVFDSSTDANLWTVAGLVGGPAGPVRLYGKAGATSYSVTATTTETIADVTVTVDDVPVTVPGGTQKFERTSEGWGWLAGGGGEVWFNRNVGLYGDLSFAWLSDDPRNGDAAFEDRLMLIYFGVRVHLGR